MTKIFFRLFGRRFLPVGATLTKLFVGFMDILSGLTAMTGSNKGCDDLVTTLLTLGGIEIGRKSPHITYSF